MIKIKLLFFIILVGFPFNFAISKTIIKNGDGYTDIITTYTVDYHSDAHGIVYKKNGGGEKIKIKASYPNESEFRKGNYDFPMDIIYNNKMKKIKYLGSKWLNDIDIINAQTTDDFCNKKYLVVTIREFVYFSGPENRYLELFFDMQKNKKSFSIFRYNDLKYPSNGPLPLDHIQRTTKQICREDGIEFIYDASAVPPH